ncbi:helix-turn-helix domain-containing protein [Rudaeicoccus suwonensis]|uniref:IclR family transcriptional regulator n=1 Tax=Rudaeicoccus suwonensis TaxID=657409 RepID=A0A561E3W4_9MICO|nr:helix-turn-helix domain-containing protein [Rudaeicoccus suwonensis]TWE10270.1 IclR family transcriptional regulator [Rudaeicoccus suwonensis]
MKTHRTVDRITDILDAVARSQRGMSASEVATTLQVPMSSAHDLLTGLAARGWLVRDGSSYRIGSAPYVLGVVAGGGDPTYGVDIDEVARRCALPAAIAVRTGATVLYTSRSSRVVDDRLSYIADAHLPRRLLATAAGRLLVALAPTQNRRAILADERRSDRDVVRAFEAALPTIRRERIAWSDGMADPGVAAVAVAIGQAPIAAAIVVFGHRDHDRETLRAAAAILTE